MQFTLSCGQVLPIFSQAIKTCDTKASDTDSAFLFKEKDDSLWITSLNKDAEQTILLPCTDLVAETGENFFVSGQSILEFFRQFPDEEALCVFNQNILTIKGTIKSIEFNFPTMETDDFAPFNYVPKDAAIDIDASAFAKSLQLTSFSASNNPSDGIWTAVRVSLLGDKMVTQSTDNQRISIDEIDIDDIGLNTIDFLLPKETSDILPGLLSNIDTITLERGKRHIRFKWENTTFVSRLISNLDEEFTDLTEYVTGNLIASVKLSKGDLLRSLKLAGLMAKDSYIKLECSDEGLRVLTDDKDKGTSSNLIEGQIVVGKADTLVPYKNLLKGVEIIDNAWIVVEFREMSFTDVFGICLVNDSYRHFVWPAVPNNGN